MNKKIRHSLMKFFVLGIFFAGFLVFDRNNFTAEASCFCYCSTSANYLKFEPTITTDSACLTYCKDYGTTKYSTNGSIKSSNQATEIKDAPGGKCADTTMCCLSQDKNTCTKCAKDGNTSGQAVRLLCSDSTCAPKLVAGIDADRDGRIDSASGGTNPSPSSSPSAPSGGTGSSGEGSGATGSAVFQNPLKFDTVEGFLNHFLTVLQRIIVTLSLVAIVVGAVMYIISGGNSGMIEKAKGAITASLIGLTLGIAAPSFLKEISFILGWTGETTPEVAAALTLTQVALNILSFLLASVGILSILMMVLGGVMYLSSAGNEDRIQKGKDIAKNAVIGIVISLSAMVLVRQIASFFDTKPAPEPSAISETGEPLYFDP